MSAREQVRSRSRLWWVQVQTLIRPHYPELDLFTQVVLKLLSCLQSTLWKIDLLNVKISPAEWKSQRVSEGLWGRLCCPRILTQDHESEAVQVWNLLVWNIWVPEGAELTWKRSAVKLNTQISQVHPAVPKHIVRPKTWVSTGLCDTIQTWFSEAGMVMKMLLLLLLSVPRWRTQILDSN